MQRQQRPATASNDTPPADAPGEVFARRVREVRLARGLKQTELAALVTERLGSTLHSTGVTRIESGRQAVTIDQAWVMAGVLEVDLAELLVPSPAMDAEAALARAQAHLADLEQQVRMIEAEREIAATRVARLSAIVDRERNTDSE